MKNGDYVLGLDVGVASVGWSIVGVGPDEAPRDLRSCGVVLFEAGTETGKGGLDAISAGQDTPLNTARREARLMRRQVWRRAKRKRKLLRALIAHGLLPAPEGDSLLRTPKSIDEFLKAIDRGHEAKWGTNHRARQTWPYLMRRDAAAGREMEAFEVGRAIYHLAQRRGFLSNRRTDTKPKKEEDKSAVKQTISVLQAGIDSLPDEPRTLGAYLAGLNPDEHRLRGGGRWTARSMYLHEFELIWSAQCARLAQLMTPRARTEIETAIFFQRPLKDQSHLIGKCSLIPDQRRAPMALREYQRFRVLQTVNAVEVSIPDQAARRLTEAERAALTEALCKEGDMTFAAVKKLLGNKKAILNFEASKAKGLIGHRTDAKLREVFGARFDELTERERDQVADDVRSLRSAEALAGRGRSRWGLDHERATLLSGVALEEARGSISLKAVRRLMPHLERGLTYAEARHAEFGGSGGSEAMSGKSSLEKLPPVLKVMEDLRNPTVLRALTEVRKLVNAIVRRHGKPSKVRIELARDLKNPRGVRERMTRQNRERESARDALKKRIVNEGGVPHPSREDIEKAILFEECGGICPYTGKPIDFASMFGRHPQVDIEHIWPRSRCLDDSMLNKTLCYLDENRARKRGRTPFEAYGGGSAKDNERYGQMLDRVLRFRGDPFARKEKHRRFAATEIDAGFENRHLSDTRFIARACADYLALLYGGNTQLRVDEEGTRRVETPTGGLTAWLRTGWGLSRLLGETGDKNREDHRHHAIDAIVIALSDQRAVKRLADAAKRAETLNKRRAFEEVDEPFAGFGEQAARLVESIVVAHRQSRKVSGALHNETVYSKNLGTPQRPEYRVRKELHKLTPSEVEDGRIVDKRALAAIRNKLTDLGVPKPDAKTIGQVFGNPDNLPMVRGHDGAMVKLKKVRVRAAVSPRQIGRTGGGNRNIVPSSNHHTAIFEVKRPKGGVAWEDRPVTMLDATSRLDAGRPVVDRVCPSGGRFVFSLSPGEHLEIDDPSGNVSQRAVFRVSSVSEGDMELKRHADGRTADELKKAKLRVRVSGEKLRKLNARKVRVTYLGEILPAND